MLENIIIIAAVALVLTIAIAYVYKEKKSGKKCIGCPHSSTCQSGKCGCNKK